MMKKSIIVLVCNGEKYLRKCVSGFLNVQTSQFSVNKSKNRKLFSWSKPKFSTYLKHKKLIDGVKRLMSIEVYSIGLILVGNQKLVLMKV